MKRNQGKALLGVVHINIEGERIIDFLHRCSLHKLPIWDIHMYGKNKAQAQIYLHHYATIVQLSNLDQCIIVVRKHSGLVHHFLQLWRRKERLIAIFGVIAVIFTLSNIIWKINIDGLSTEMEMKLGEELKNEGFYTGAWARSLPAVKQMEDHMLNKFPELLVFSMEKKGTIYQIDAVEKVVEKENPKSIDKHLVAQKNGIVHKMLIKEGQAVVQVYDYVRKGQLLVSGIISKDENDLLQEDIIIGAEGKVFANTWHELTVEGNLHTSHEKLSGEKSKTIYAQLGKFRIPIWGDLFSAPFEESYSTFKKKQIAIRGRNLPIVIIQESQYEKSKINIERTVEQAKKMAIESGLETVRQKLGKDSQVLKYYVLHEAVENGKVRLRLYVSTLENIATSAPIQMDNQN